MTAISYQLYSSRNFPPLRDTLSMLADLGYGQVEGHGGVYDDLPELVRLLRDNALTMTSGHFGLHMLEQQSGKILEIADALGMRAIYCPHLAQDLRPDNAAGWQAFGERLQRAGEPYRAAGHIFGWHNHDFEFADKGAGWLPLDEIFKGAPDLSWEADIAWIVCGGGDPHAVIARHGQRISAVHVKDIAPEGRCLDEDGWADVGHGVMDWKSLIAELERTPAQFFVMEHDNPSDDARFAARSIAAFRALQDHED